MLQLAIGSEAPVRLDDNITPQLLLAYLQIHEIPERTMITLIQDTDQFQAMRRLSWPFKEGGAKILLTPPPLPLPAYGASHQRVRRTCIGDLMAHRQSGMPYRVSPSMRFHLIPSDYGAVLALSWYWRTTIWHVGWRPARLASKTRKD